ncbi:uncharacterized protein ACMZJ9_001160 [Mantella aurantiaca]
MDEKCIFCVFCSWLIFDIGEPACTNMFPRITEPKNNTLLQVRPGSYIDLYCSADIGNIITVNYTMLYWIINGNFTDYYDKAQESNTVVTRDGNFTYISKVLHIYEVAAEFYNVPITCVLQTANGYDTSTLYFTSLTAEYWAVIIPVIFIVLCLLAVFAYIQYRFSKNAAQ